MIKNRYKVLDESIDGGLDLDSGVVLREMESFFKLIDPTFTAQNEEGGEKKRKHQQIAKQREKHIIEQLIILK